MMKILHLDNNHPLLRENLATAGFENSEDYTSPKSAIEQVIEHYDGIVIRSRFNIDQQFLDAATNLKFIARVGAGLESIDFPYAESKGIKLFSAPEGNRNAVGEHALGMLLSLFNKLNNADREVKNGQWNREANRGIELDGKTVGIIGYGNMGKAFAKKLRGFDCEVLCYDIKEDVGDENARQTSLEELQEKADVLSLHTPWTERTNKMVDSQFIHSFKKPFWLINTARGKSVVTSDLVDALKKEKILGAGLDVLEYEKLSFESLFTSEDLPKPFEQLLQFDNVIVSPHVAGWTVESKIKLAEVISEKIIANFGEKPSEEIIEKKQNLPKRVTGIGGIFFKTKDPKATKEWYKTHLGFNTDDWGCTFWWKDEQGKKSSTQWSTFSADTTYFEPATKDFMFNYRVENLVELLTALKNEGVTIVGEMQEYEYGKFGWIIDNDGNKIELWEPVDSAFL